MPGVPLKRITVDGQHVVLTPDTLEEMRDWLRDHEGLGLPQTLSLTTDEILTAITQQYPGGIAAFLSR